MIFLALPSDLDLLFISFQGQGIFKSGQEFHTDIIYIHSSLNSKFFRQS